MNSNLNKNISVFFIDLDGTLVDKENDSISDFNLQAIKNFTSINDNKIIVSTGRIGESAIHFMHDLQSDYIIMGNGSLIMDKNNELIYEKRLNPNSIQIIKDFITKNKLSYKIDGTNVSFNCKSFFTKVFSKKYGYVPNPEHANSEEILYKMVLFGKTVQKMNKFVKQLEKELSGNCSIVTSSGGFTIEITNAEATKGNANEFIWKQMYKISDILKTAHIGDSMNDSTTKGKVGYLFALKNSSKQLLKISDIQGPHYKNHGVGIILMENTKIIN